MAEWELIDDNSDTGVRKWIAADPHHNGAALVRTECSGRGTAALLSRNRTLQNEAFDRRSDLWHAASIPTAVMYEWLTKFGVNAWNPAHADAVKKLLNSGDYRWCKVKNIIL